MSAVDAGFAVWLRSNALFAEAADGAVESAWGARATISEIVSPLALKAAADSESARQRTLLNAALAVDRLSVSGLRSDLLGKVVALTSDRFGYNAGVSCFVIGVVEGDAVERTTLTVIRRL